MIDLDVKHFFSSGVYAKQMTLDSGNYALTHKHNYDHLSILSKGIALVECDGIGIEYSAPACIEIKAGVEHKITAIEDTVWFCIHATNVTDIEEIDSTLIDKNA